MKNLLTSLLVIASVLIQSGLALAESKSTTYYVPDALGSPIAAMDEQGNVKWRKHYRPYGEEIEQDAASVDNSIGYTGHAHDRNTGLTYMGARYYDPVIGRFMGMDPVGFNEASPVSMNRYAYANNNPYMFVDPDGKESLRLSIEGNAPAVGMLIQAVVNTISPDSNIIIPEGLNAGVTLSFPGLSGSGEYGIAGTLDAVIGLDAGIERSVEFDWGKFIKSLWKVSYTGEADFNWTKKQHMKPQQA